MSILAAVSGERHQDRVVEVGADLASAFDVELVVLHVMTDNQFQEIRDTSEMAGQFPIEAEGGGLVYVPTKTSDAGYNLEDAESDAADIARKCVSETVAAESVDVTCKGRVGDPAAEILNMADRIDARYAVVGGRKRTPTGKAIFGSVAQSVILTASQPIVAITYQGE